MQMKKKGKIRKFGFHNITDRHNIIKIILTKNLTESENEYYFKLLLNSSHNN